MREQVPLTLRNSKNPHAKLAAKPPTFGALFVRFLEGFDTISSRKQKALLARLARALIRPQAAMFHIVPC